MGHVCIYLLIAQEKEEYFDTLRPKFTALHFFEHDNQQSNGVQGQAKLAPVKQARSVEKFAHFKLPKNLLENCSYARQWFMTSAHNYAAHNNTTVQPEIFCTATTVLRVQCYTKYSYTECWLLTNKRQKYLPYSSLLYLRLHLNL